ncbi:dihydroorotate dehydrogenase [Candidatus Woesearchaeota archaeon]|nr:dihydroorotate dehydrogenase [Candidatus Woesearchaeota archaeon]
MTPNISVNLAGIKLKNPTVLASGIVGISRASLRYAAANGAGAVTTKSITPEPRKGHPAPIILTYEGGMINSVGLSNPGIDNIDDEFKDLKSVGAPVLGSITGRTPKEFGMLAEKADKMDFTALEVVLSCPHTPGYGTMAGLSTPELTEKITRIVKARTRKPVFVKLSPNVMGLVELAKAAERGGADGITAVNTAGPGMMIDIKTYKPILGGKVGGLSGHALRPIALRCVFEIYEAVKIPIIGTGGISTGEHAVEMILAGATAVGIGTGVWDRGIDVFNKVCLEIRQIMAENSWKSLDEIRGKAHEK